MFDPNRASNELRNQWSQPFDVLPLLLLFGGDIIAGALAVSAGEHPPVTFSFGKFKFLCAGVYRP